MTIDCIDCTAELLIVIVVEMVLSEVAGSNASVAVVEVGRTSAAFVIVSA